MLNIDNQVTIKMMKNLCPQSAQYLINIIKADLNRIHREELNKPPRQILPNQKSIKFEFKWVAGHMGSKGNKAADKLAKQEAEFGSSKHYSLPACLCSPLLISLSATKQQIEAIMKKDMKTWWK
jgi:hypothetical protein